MPLRPHCFVESGNANAVSAMPAGMLSVAGLRREAVPVDFFSGKAGAPARRA